MNFDLWYKVLKYSCELKYPMPSRFVPVPDRILFKRVCERFIINKFLEKWLDNPEADAEDILDGMLLFYSMYQNYARERNEKELVNLYDIYIKTLIGIKNQIKDFNKEKR